jgi:hypothetical protein
MATSSEPLADNQYRTHLYELCQKAQDQYDKTLVLLAGGALGLSLTFIGSIVGAKVPKNQDTLAWGWVALIVSLVVILVSFFTSRYALRATISRFELGHEQPHRNNWDKTTELCNALAGILFITGVICIVRFALNNLGTN